MKRQIKAIAVCIVMCLCVLALAGCIFEPANSHTHSAKHVPAAAPSCTKTGNTEYWYCEGCNTRFSDEALTKAVSVADSTIPASHSSTEFTYSVNSADPTKHDKKHACCGTVAETSAHEWDNGVPDTDNPEDTVYTCTRCGATTSEPTQAPPEIGHTHSAEVVNATPPTCTADGNFKYWYCEGCDTKFSDEALTTPVGDSAVVWAKTGHTVNIWRFVSETPKDGETCKFNQVFKGECSVCTEEETKTVTSVRHTLAASITTPAKCNNVGMKTYVCKYGCSGTSEQREYTDSNAHAWVKGAVTSGIATYSCTHCSDTKTVAEYQGISAAVDKTVLAENEISIGNISMKLDDGALGLLAGGEVLVEAKELIPSEKETLAQSLTGTLRDLVLNGTVYDFGIKQNNTYLPSFGDGKVTVTVPYTPTSGDIDLIAVCYVSSDGTVEVVGASYSNNTLTFDAKHFSAYIPTYVDSDIACTLYGHNFSEDKVSPTCTERGYTVKCCERCGTSLVTDIVYEQGHLWDAGVGTPSTCTEEGSITYTCTRADCGETLTVSVAKKAHSYEYDEENSKPATCTEGGKRVEVCSACGDTLVTNYEAMGHSTQFGRVEYTLAEGAADCLGGVLEKRYCGNPDCTYSETVATHNEHVYLFDKMTSPEDYPSIAAGTVTVNVLDYTDYDYMAWASGGTTPPTITITPGCLCGGLIHSVEFTGGDLISEFATYSTHITSESEPPKLITIGGFGNPMEGFSPNLYILFEVRTESDVCRYKKYVDIYIGENSDGSEALYQETVLIQEYDSHILSKSAHVVTPGLSCYENSYKHEFEGIVETTICKRCSEVIEERFVSVSSSSSHYYLTYGNSSYSYNMPLIGASYTSHHISFTLQSCPCGTFYVKRTGYCNFSDIGTATVEGKEITIRSCYSCGFKYGYLEVKDESTCNKKTTYTYYVNFDQDTNTYDAKLSYSTEYVQHNRKVENTDLPSDNPCIHKYNQHVYCLDCNEEISENVYSEWTHDENKSETIDEHGNVITNISCKRDGCIYHSNVIRDKNGNVLRDYYVSENLNSGNIDKSLTISTEVHGIITQIFYRDETYDTENNLISWSQTTTEFSYDEKYGGCIRIDRYSNSNGGYSESVNNACNYYDSPAVSQMSSCVLDGYEYRLCTVCGTKYYSYQDSARGHYYSPIYDQDNNLIGYYCTTCSFESPTDGQHSVELERLWSMETGDTIIIGYKNRYALDGQVGIAAEATLIVATFAGDGTITAESEITTVNLTDDGVSKLTADANALTAILDTAPDNSSIMLKVELNDGTETVFRMKLI